MSTEKRDEISALAVKLGTEGRWNEALKCWADYFNEFDGDGGAYYHLAVALYGAAHKSQAFIALEEAIKRSPRHAMAHARIGFLYMESGNFGKAIEHYSEALRLKPGLRLPKQWLVRAYVQKGRETIWRGSVEEAIALYQDALNVEPGHAEAQYRLGEALARLGEHAQAIDAWKTVLDKDVRNTRLHYNMGVAFDALGKLKEASQSYQMALSLDPGNVRAMNNLGCALARQGRSDEALDVFQRAVTLEPSDAVLRFNLGQLHLDAGRIDAAIEELRLSIRLNSEHARGHGCLSEYAII